MTTDHAVYRLVDRQGKLLYVGVTVSLKRRLAEHRSDKPWWPEVQQVDVMHFATREAAEEAERAAIANEAPLYNCLHTEAHRVVCSTAMTLVELHQRTCDGLPVAERSTRPVEDIELLRSELYEIKDPVARVAEIKRRQKEVLDLSAEFASITRETAREMKKTMSFGEIAKALGISRGRAQQLASG